MRLISATRETQDGPVPVRVHGERFWTWHLVAVSFLAFAIGCDLLVLIWLLATS